MGNERAKPRGWNGGLLGVFPKCLAGVTQWFVRFPLFPTDYGGQGLGVCIFTYFYPPLRVILAVRQDWKTLFILSLACTVSPVEIKTVDPAPTECQALL